MTGEENQLGGVTMEQAIEYFKSHCKIFCDDYMKKIPKDSIAYHTTLKEKEFYDMAIKSLEQTIDKEKMIEDYCDEQYAVYSDRTKQRAFGAKKVGALINELPPVTPTRKKGKWEYVGDNCFKCSECGEVYTVDQFNHINNYCDNRFPKGCPNCATEMESEDGN